ncbi:MAG TPA: carboxymuconolactone decarboxylase family protein [Gemmatimonadaceae bacterium]|nr:carboxymuconolactone decarboxylase family protein [Gemmatimonadaceae bacterium]
MTTPRITNAGGANPEVYRGLLTLSNAAAKLGVPRTTLLMVSLRASQINGCSFCVDMHWRELRDEGEPDEKIFAVAAWRETPYFTDAERAALALTEAGTRLADRSDAVPDALWNEAAQYYDEKGLTALVIAIAAINTWNRLNVMTRQAAGEASKAAAEASAKAAHGLAGTGAR